MKRQITTALLALGLSATPALAAPHSHDAACAKLAEIAWQGAVDRDRGVTEQDELTAGVQEGLTPDQQFYFKFLNDYVFAGHANEPPSQVERSFYRDCMDANSDE